MSEVMVSHKTLKDESNRNRFDRKVLEKEEMLLESLDLEVFQVNILLTCNLECRHCHVASSPRRTEQMSRETFFTVLDAAESVSAKEIDITGGAPEMHPHFREFVTVARQRGFAVKVRTNLTILLEEGYEDIPRFYREQKVTLVASLPCYLEDNVDTQRGNGVFRASIEALRRLNQEGFGVEEELPIFLVYNPVGPHLPPPQPKLEQDYKRELRERYGIRFTGLYTITNMPIGRYLSDLKRAGRAREYLDLLETSYNPDTLDSLMCRHQLNIGYDGILYDCDFNLALRLPLAEGLPRNIRDFDAELLRKRRIVTGFHCFGCTAGCGSSCGGALV